MQETFAYCGGNGKSQKLTKKTSRRGVSRMIGKCREIVQANKIRGSLLHCSNVDVISDMICIIMLEWIHYWRHIGFVMIRLTACRVPGVEVWLDGGCFSNSNVGRKNAIQRRVQRLQIVETSWRREMRDLHHRNQRNIFF